MWPWVIVILALLLVGIAVWIALGAPPSNGHYDL
jgi:hypothetical protein